MNIRGIMTKLLYLSFWFSLVSSGQPTFNILRQAQDDKTGTVEPLPTRHDKEPYFKKSRLQKNQWYESDKWQGKTSLSS